GAAAGVGRGPPPTTAAAMPPASAAPGTGGETGSRSPGAGPGAGTDGDTDRGMDPGTGAGAAGPVPGRRHVRRAAWRIGEEGGEHEIEGYADRVSVLPGERFRLLVSTTAPGFTARAFRMGARPELVWRSGSVPGVRQAEPLTVGGMVTAAHWKPSLTVDTTGWREGAYLVRLDASTGGGRYVPITVRSSSARGRVVLVNAVTTWQAHNRWGGRDLAEGGGEAPKVTFDRPYDGTGADFFTAYERRAVAVAERSGAPLAYLTSVDLTPGALRGALAVVSPGWDAYWSPGMRAALTRAGQGGADLAFLHPGPGRTRIGLYGRLIRCEGPCPRWRTPGPPRTALGLHALLRRATRGPAPGPRLLPTPAHDTATRTS
ncbi:N,N-dimethylformamidase beta subunit family domain-containing protein, partial [Nonomuraea sp. NPDC050691]|uniref:N,N-dimethylformamidase beta subunit family domain-containing protein n=1 Tax=Nonomuraea sp. NPDC050691 TaxID=3155661 RepID=UPI0034030D7C